MLAGHDVFEGIRAAVVDKDRQPRWQPATLADIAPDAIDRHFAPAEDGDLDLDLD
jgi:enoyl-CoA hydratase